MLLYSLTVFVAGWSIYYSAVCIAAVKPYTAKHAIFDALQALGWSPLFLLGALFFAGGVMLTFLRKSSVSDKLECLACVIWFGSLFGPAINHQAKEEYLDKRIVWTGTCNDLEVSSEEVTTDPFLVGPAHFLKPSATCRGTRLDVSFPPEPQYKEGMEGKDIPCTISASGIARCKTPQID